MPSKSRYLSTEASESFLVNELSKKVKDHLLKSGMASKSDTKGLLDKMKSVMESVETSGQKFQFTYVSNHLGGARWFVTCPKCGAPCVKLYKPDIASGREPRFLCAKCHGMKSPSALLGPTAKYKDIIKPLKRMTKIRETLRTSKKISDEEARELMREHEELRAAMLDSAIYQRMKFQLEAEGLLKNISL